MGNFNTLFVCACNSTDKKSTNHWFGYTRRCELRKINGDKNVLLLKNILIEAGYNSISTLVNEQMTKSRITVSFSQFNSERLE